MKAADFATTSNRGAAEISPRRQRFRLRSSSRRGDSSTRGFIGSLAMPVIPAEEAPLSASELTTAGEPRACAKQFWQNISTGNVDAAQEIARAVRAPPVAVGAFNFDTDEGGEVTGGPVDDEDDEFVDAGEYLLQVSPTTPPSVINCWNSEKEVSLTLVKFDQWCLAKAEKVGGPEDFRVCMKQKSGAEGCQKTTHMQTEGTDDIVKLSPPDEENGMGIMAIVCPSARPNPPQPSFFSGPLFLVSQWPNNLREMGRHELLFEIKAVPRAWRCFLGEYPGSQRMMHWYLAIKDDRTPVPSVLQTPGSKRNTGGDVREAPGLSSVLKDYHGAATSASRPANPPRAARPQREPAASESRARLFVFSDDESDYEDSEGGDDNERSRRSRAGTVSTLGEGAQLADLIAKVDKLSKKVRSLEDDKRQIVDEFGKVIRKQRRQIRKLEDKVDDSLPTAGEKYFGGDPYRSDVSLDERARSSIVQEVLAQANLTAYAKSVDLDSYVTHRELTAFGFVNQAQLNAATSSPILLPARLQPRLEALEKEFFDSGGTVDKLQLAIKDILSKKVGDSVTIAGHTFRDAAAAAAWAAPFKDPELFGYAVDAKAQIAGAMDDAFTSSEILAQRADVKKAGFASVKAAKIATTYDLTYPEVMIRHSAGQKDAKEGGYVFQPGFSSYDLYQGDALNSTRDGLIKKLEINRDKHQAAIDHKFPPDQPRHAKANAIFSYILRMGHKEAVGFLNSLGPFFRMMTRAGLSDAEAWDKVLTFVKAVFDRIAQVRNVSSDNDLGPGFKIYGAMRATALLEGYSDLGWIRHPDVSSALVVASMQREGKGVSDAVSSLSQQIATNKSNITKLDRLTKALKEKNPSLNF